MAATKRLLDKLAAQGRAVEAIDNTPATDATSASVEIEGTDITNIESLADGSVDMPAATPAVAAAQNTIAQIEAALAVLGSENPAAATLQAALADAQGTLALAQADALLNAQKAAEIAAATSAAASLAPDLLAAMLAAIEARYAPTPAPTVEAAALPVGGKKPVGTATAERNATVGALLAADATLEARAVATIDAFRTNDQTYLAGVQAQAGTRYASLLVFAEHGAGVVNVADYKILATAIRLRLLLPPYGLGANGEGTASVPWLSATRIHGAGGSKGNDSLPLKFTDRREVALYPDGRFRLARPAQAGMRYIRTDAQALAIFEGGSGNAYATPAPTAAASAAAAPTTPRVPTPPAQAAQANGSITSTARCQHCHARNFTANPVCTACAAADWQAA